MGNFSGNSGNHTEKGEEHHDVKGKPPDNDSETLCRTHTAGMPTAASRKRKIHQSEWVISHK